MSFLLEFIVKINIKQINNKNDLLQETKRTAGPFWKGYSIKIATIDKWICIIHIHGKLKTVIFEIVNIRTSVNLNAQAEIAKEKAPGPCLSCKRNIKIRILIIRILLIVVRLKLWQLTQRNAPNDPGIAYRYGIGKQKKLVILRKPKVFIETKNKHRNEKNRSEQ